MKQRQQFSTLYPITFLMVDSTDHVTGKSGLTPTVTISKNGGAFAPSSGAVSEIGNGWYALAGNATDRETLGDLLIHATGTGADPVDDRYCVVPWDPFDAVRLGLTAMPPAAAGAAGGMPVLDANLAAAANVTYWAGDAVAGAPALEATAQAILEDTGTTLPAAIGGQVLEGAYTRDDVLRILAAALAGKTSGSGTDTVEILGLDDVTTRITATVSPSGNRTAMTLDGGVV